MRFFPPLDLVKFYPSLPFPPFDTHFNPLSSTALGHMGCKFMELNINSSICNQRTLAAGGLPEKKFQGRLQIFPRESLSFQGSDFSYGIAWIKCLAVNPSSVQLIKKKN